MALKFNSLALLFAATIVTAFTGTAFAALLGVQPGYPQISYNIGSVTPATTYSYDGTTGVLTVTAAPLSYRASSTATPVLVNGTKSLSITVHLDATGKLIPNVAGDNITVIGTVVAGGQTYTGTLLTGKPTAFGFFNSTTTTDTFDFRFSTTDGTLKSAFTGKDIGVTLTSESSTFNGSFAAGFQGNAKGTIGTLAGPYMSLAETCTDATGSGPIAFSAVLTNTGSEALTSITCTSTPESAISGTPGTLDVGASATITGSYTPTGTPSSSAVNCSATGNGSQVSITATSQATCNVIATPAISVTAYCGDAPAPGQPITLTGLVANSGNELLTDVTCTDSKGTVIAGVPATLAPGATASISASYVPTGSNSTDIVTCSAKGGMDNLVVSANASTTCSIKTAPAFTVTESCSNAPAPGQPITLTGTITNTGNETLTGFSCTDSKGAAITGVPATLAPGSAASISGSYVPTGSNSGDTISCSATGAINSVTVSANANATCGIVTKPAFTVSESCSNAPAPGQPITLTGVIANTGNETLNGFSCTDSKGAVLAGIPATLAPGASAPITGSYVPTGSNSSDTITCSATGAINSASVSANSSATCGIDTKPAFTVSESCSNAPAPGQPITLTGVIANTGNETLSGFSCSDSKGAVLAGIPATLAPGASAPITGSYVPTGSNSSDTITCSATGGINSASVSANSSATCGIDTKPVFTVSESCSNAAAPGQAITLTGVITNTGNEPLSGLSCTDSKGAVFAGVPATLAPGASAPITGSYIPTGSNSSDTVTCSATGAINSASVSANSSATCGIDTKVTWTINDSCANAGAPGLPIGISAVISNTGNDTITGIVCSDSKGGSLTNVPTSLAPGASATMTGGYVTSLSPSTDMVTCSGYGITNATAVTGTSSATCQVLTAPSLTLTESCSNASAPGQPIGISGLLTNTGNESLAGFNCTDSQGAVLTGVPTTLAPGASATLTGSYVPTSGTSTDTISCTASGSLSASAVSANSNATCGVNAQACVSIKKQVSTTCTVTGSKDKHCKTDETKDDYCKRSDCDQSYCANTYQTKLSYCHEVTLKQSHCGSSESKGTHCSKSDCDHGYCNSDDNKDDYCKIPAAPTCVPVWLDADTEETGATMGITTKTTDSGDDFLSKLANGTLSQGGILDLLKKLKLGISHDDSDEAYIQDVDKDDDDNDDTYDAGEYYQGHVRQSPLAYRFLVTNCGQTDLTGVTVTDPTVGVTGYSVGNLAAGASVTLTADQIPQLALPTKYCTQSFVNTATVIGQDVLGNKVSDSDDAWVVCNTKTCTFTQGYWKNHPGNWPVSTLKLGSVSYSQTQLLAIFNTPVSGNGVIALAHQLIAAKLNVANGTMVPTTIQQAITSADAMIGALVVPPVGSGSLDTATTSTLTGTLDAYNSGTLPGGPTHCGDTTPPQQCTGVIGDFVWNDVNKNGAQNGGEAGIAKVKVTLSNGKSAYTDATGHYQFTGLCQGSYTVKVSPPCGWSATTPTSVTVNLTSDSASNLSADFGLAKPSIACTGKIGDYIWNDTNMNGVQDSTESGLAGITVLLSNGDQTSTDATGHYQFTGLCAGDYTITVATPAGYTASPTGQGGNTAKDSKGSPAKVTLTASSSSVQNIDFGFYKTPAPTCTGVIGNYVWNDLNKNGIQECKEPGLAGVTVKLSNGMSSITDADGHYQFSGLCAGTYTVTVLTPAGFTPSPTLQGNSRAADSNPTPSTVTLADNRASDLTVDFGFYKLPTPTCGKGCSLGYWKTHTANWPSASHTTDNFDSVFGTNAFTPDITLLQALNLGGGGVENLARQAAAALLNAEDGRISGFPLTVAQIKAAVVNAVVTGNYDALATQLDGYNNLGCPLN
ncbi:SdrD B-like domain-containing protein [Geomesophilobacter sediminis]|uniref:SD-repeat containing protein B domain-containing protein n=1 Tax=Geomesophilobacter sediminis TaxID=2798584 RepID=A0A8J7IM55_9BACT|nr:SdrD B-like domain-containing protein [Geomesophilobacter sediminis]MBJ6723708.1 hypothetical protein [Geomesophilobacter sediminis]